MRAEAVLVVMAVTIVLGGGWASATAVGGNCDATPVPSTPSTNQPTPFIGNPADNGSPVIAIVTPDDQSAARETGVVPIRWQEQWLMLGLGALAFAGFLLIRGWRLPRAPGRPMLIRTPEAVAFYLGYVLLGMLGALAATALLMAPEPEADAPSAASTSIDVQAPIMLASYLGPLAIVAAWVILRRKRRRQLPERRQRWRWPIWQAALLGVGGLMLFWLMSAATSTIAALLVQMIEGAPPPTIAHDTLALVLESEFSGWMLVLLALVILAAPVVEEVIYRGCVQETLRQHGLPGWGAIGLTSAFFALMHLGAVEPHALAALFVLSLGFGWVYEKSGRLTGPIIMHILFNAGNLTLAMLLPAP